MNKRYICCEVGIFLPTVAKRLYLSATKKTDGVRMTHSTAQLRLFCLLLMAGCFLQGAAVAAEGTTAHSGTKLSAITQTVIDDYKSFYSIGRLTILGLGFGVGALAANTNMDHYIQERYQEDIRNSGTDDVAKKAKVFGEGKYVIPLSLLAAGIKYFDNASSIGDWGAHCARAYLTGGPAVVFMQRVTGGSRPGETNHDSEWRPFNDSNGLSGHAFVGAVPLLTIAKMNRDTRYLKYICYVASAATAWSRVNDNSHYLSQAALGWYMAWQSVDAVFDTDQERQAISITPAIGRDRYGIALNIKW
jgi:hypothetical protein